MRTKKYPYGVICYAYKLKLTAHATASVLANNSKCIIAPGGAQLSHIKLTTAAKQPQLPLSPRCHCALPQADDCVVSVIVKTRRVWRKCVVAGSRNASLPLPQRPSASAYMLFEYGFIYTHKIIDCGDLKVANQPHTKVY
ncbi:unnamed protein product [Ceratitis capitata]|uniref:(Mediterranean fruit fly) hypothetical protein n=1 Tax=Ceratitis capitata TaxID=7213 RepID=A0A811VCW7_CERCA|nr:unnamed protein product [Ceratitis capitata]